MQDVNEVVVEQQEVSQEQPLTYGDVFKQLEYQKAIRAMEDAKDRPNRKQRRAQMKQMGLFSSKFKNAQAKIIQKYATGEVK